MDDRLTERTAQLLAGDPLTEQEAQTLYERINWHTRLSACIEVEQGELLLYRLGWEV